MLRAVLFDAGETLVHPAPSFPELFVRVLARAGHERSLEDVVSASGAVLHRFSEAAADRELWTTSPERSARFWTSVYERMLGELGVADGDGLAVSLYATFTDRANYALFDDVPATLDALDAAGLTVGIVSNFEAWLEDLLADLDVRDRFAVRVISGIEGIEKPDPEIFERALDRLGVAATEAVYVGDNPELDVDPAVALGMTAVLIDRRDRHAAHGGPRVRDLRDLAPLLEVA
ncbi:MAG TPA: HAD-IA family hydrolase [Actinomycetota bacterium]|nr:HAD-IA family hydrolase [Actinomycetota bacterium]